MPRPLTIILTLLCSFSVVMAQPELRMEQTNLPPAVGTLLRAGGKVFHRSYMGLHVYEPSSQTWRYVGEATKQLDRGTWIVHPNGVVVVRTMTGTTEFNAVTESVDFHDGVNYQVRHSDTIVANLDVVYKDDTTTMRMVWLRWPSMDTVRVDEIRTRTMIAQDFVIPCYDGSILASTATRLCRFHFDRQPSVVELTDEITSDRHYVYSDPERTHIVLTGRSNLVHSTDLFETRSYVSAALRDSVRQVRLTSNPDVVYLSHSGIVERVHRFEFERDTIHRGLSNIFANFEVLGDTAILGIRDSVLIINSDRVDVVNTGLPSRSLMHVAALSGGLIATSSKEVLAHPSGGEWSVLPLETGGFLSNNGLAIIPMGGNSIDDFWFVSGDVAFHVNPRTAIEKYDFGFPGYISRGLHTRSGVSYFTMLYALEESCGSNQVVWASGNSPVRTLLCKDDLRALMVFNNRDHVALTRDGIAWRTVDGDLDQWERIDVPSIASTNIPRTSVQGDQGLLRSGNFMMWTHNAGRTWQSIAGDVYYSAITSNGTIYTMRVTDDPDSALIVERRVDSSVSVIAAYDASVFSTQSNALSGIAFDDVERRLYIATRDWTASLSVQVSSIDESRDRTTAAPSQPEGLYDLFGRYVGLDEQSITTSGLYLRSSAEGIRKVLIVR